MKEIKLNIYTINRGKYKSGIIIKTVITDHERIKEIMKKALSDEYISANIKLNNKWKAIPALIEQNILQKEDIDKDLFFKQILKESKK